MSLYYHHNPVFRRVLRASSTLALVSFLAACQTATVSAPEEALKMSSIGLALHFLGTATLESGKRGQINNSVVRAAFETSLSLGMQTELIVFNTDGTMGIVKLATPEEFEQYLTKNRILYETYKKAIIRRGFKKLAPSYDATVSPGCSDRWFASGKVVVQQTDVIFEISQAGKVFFAAVVEDAVAVGIPRITVGKSGAPPLFGRYGKTIELQDFSKCRITLREKS